MSAVVSLREFVNEMESTGDDWIVYLNRQTGEFLSASREEWRAAEEDDDHESLLVDWQRELLPKLRETLGSNDWLHLPSKFDIHEYAIMQEFCRSVDNEVLRADLLDAIRGSGAFGRFKSMADRHGLLDQWYQYRDESFQEIARAWLEAREIAYQP